MAKSDTAVTTRIQPVATLWPQIMLEAQAAGRAEPSLASYYYTTILNHSSFAKAISYVLASLLAGPELAAMQAREVIERAMGADPGIERSILEDIQAWYDRDAACDKLMIPLLNFKGFHALQIYRVAHWLWNNGREQLALFLQNRVAELFGIDIHPGARIGCGIMIDHATGVVIGETAVVEDDVSMLHNVTLGGSGADSGKRHPTIRRGVLLGAGAKVLGDIEVGERAKVAAGSLVIESVPAGVTVAGVPARIVGRGKTSVPAMTMDQNLPSS